MANSTVGVRIMNETMKELNIKEMNRWTRRMLDALKIPQRSDFIQMFHFFEEPYKPKQLTATVDIARHSSKPCKFLSEDVRESKETGQLVGTHEVCAHPNHQALVGLRRIILGLSAMLRLLVNRSRLQCPTTVGLHPHLDPLKSLLMVVPDYLALGDTLDECVEALQASSPQKRLQFLEEGILNVCRALDVALKETGQVVKFDSNNGQMTDHFSGTSR